MICGDTPTHGLMGGLMGGLMSNHWNQINLDLIKIIQLWTFWTFYLNHLSPLWGYFLIMFANGIDIIENTKIDVEQSICPLL